MEVLSDFIARFNLPQDEKSGLRINSFDESASYDNLNLGDKLEPLGSSYGAELELDERQWLKWYRHIELLPSK